MPNVSEIAEDIGKLLLYVLGVLVAYFAGMRKISGDRLQVRQDSAAAAYIERMQQAHAEALQAERAEKLEARAREAQTWALHLDDAKTITRLEVKGALDSERIARQKKEIALLKRMLRERNPQVAAFIETGFGELFSNDQPPP